MQIQLQNKRRTQEERKQLNKINTKIHEFEKTWEHDCYMERNQIY